MNAEYRKMAAERAALGIPPLPLDEKQTKQICQWLSQGLTTPPDGDENLAELLSYRVPAGVAPAAAVKAAFLADLALERIPEHPEINRTRAWELLGGMVGGFNVPPLVEGVEKGIPEAAAALSGILLIPDDVFAKLRELCRRGNPAASTVLYSWAGADWFVRRPELPLTTALRLFKVDGEINTDDLSPAKHAVTRPDIPLHALSMGEKRFPEGVARLSRLRNEDGDFRVAFVCDTLGTGSSRKSATNSLVWHIGDDIPFVPNKRRGGIAIAGRIAPIFFNTCEDSGVLPITAPVEKLQDGMDLVMKLSEDRQAGVLECGGAILSEFALSPVIADEWRAGGRINLIIGRRLTARAWEALGQGRTKVFHVPAQPETKRDQAFTLAQKMVGRACGKPGVVPGENCDPAVSTVGSQDTTGPMTRDELTELACLKFTAPLFMQSFCHTAAYPTDRDCKTHKDLPEFINDRGGVALRPGDGIIHSWLNRMLLPDQVGTGGDSHTRFPLGISFAAGSGMVAFAAALGFMPLEMPESVLVAFKGSLPTGVTIRDVVNAIPLFAIEKGLMDRPGQGSKNVFNGRILEMEGLGALTVEEGFELTCAAAERSATAATVDLPENAVVDFVRTNVKLLESLVAAEYKDKAALVRRIGEMKKWLENPELLRRDANAPFAARLDMDLSAMTEPVVACPNNPDLVKKLSEAAGQKVDEVFIGSCMTNISHFRAAARMLAAHGSTLQIKRLWITPPTRVDLDQLEREGVMDTFRNVNARIEIPGCSLCMGNQARVEDGAVVFSTSTRNFDNRMGMGAKVFLGSAEVAALTARLGRIPTPEEYFAEYERNVAPYLDNIHRPMAL